MNAAYEIVDIKPDTEKWLAERRKSLGASELGAVLGLSEYGSPLSVYKSKHGVDDYFDPELSYVTHASEAVVEGWVREFHPEWGEVLPGFMARSVEYPWLHATFDRFLRQPDGTTIPLQIKTGHQYGMSKWADRVPFEYQAQEQGECLIFGSARARIVVMHGGRTFQWADVERDEQFIRESLVPDTRSFWDLVEAHIPPEPTTSAEAVSLWPGNPDVDELEADDETYALVALLRHAKRHEKAAKAQIESTSLELQKRMHDATVLTRDGEPLVTWKPQAGAKRLDTVLLKADHPDLVAEYTRQGESGRRFLVKEPKFAGVDA